MLRHRIAALLLSAAAFALPLDAQRFPRGVEPDASRRAAFDARALQDPAGQVALRWTAEPDARTLGFHVIRENPEGGRVRITRELIAGPAFFTAAPRLAWGRSYEWSDRVPPGSFVQYSIEEVRLDGTRTIHGPVTPLLRSGSFLPAPNATIREIGAAAEVSPGVFVSEPGIGAPAIARPEPTLSNWIRHRSLAGDRVAKLMVPTEGWVRVTRRELAEAGADPGPAPQTLALLAEGTDVPISLIGTGDGSFDLDDAIEFHGVGLDTPSSGERVYWLVRTSGAQRIATVTPRWTRLPAGTTPFTFERIERTIFFAALTNNGERENFFGTFVTGAGATVDLEVEHLGGGPATLEVVLQSATESAHRVALEVNGNAAGEISFSGIARNVSSHPIPSSMLHDGTNTLLLTALEGDDDFSLVESVRLTWRRRLAASDDALKMTVRGGSPVVVTGFTTNRVRAVDVTNALSPLLLKPRVTRLGAGFAVSFVAPSALQRTILVVGEPRFASPSRIEPAGASDWWDDDNGADLVVVSAEGLIDAAEPLIELRQSQGLSVETIPIGEIYDEFNFGVPGPEALRAFLLRTRDWDTPPRFALFLGDATADPRDYLGLGAFPSVPTKLVATEFTKTASDNWFADFEDDGLPQIALGRLPARTADELEVMVGKIVGRANASERAAFIAGPNDLDGNDFESAVATLAEAVPDEVPVTTVATGQIANDVEAIEEAFDSRLLVYSGHGSVNYWAAGPMWGADFAALQNAPDLPVMAVMNCLNGSFHEPYETSAAETLLANEDGGAVAVWASSALTFLIPQIPMAERFLEELYEGATIGEAAMRARSATDDLDVRRSWILFGDPTMGLW